jgi:hypothetical protein
VEAGDNRTAYCGKSLHSRSFEDIARVLHLFEYVRTWVAGIVEKRTYGCLCKSSASQEDAFGEAEADYSRQALVFPSRKVSI